MLWMGDKTLRHRFEVIEVDFEKSGLAKFNDIFQTLGVLGFPKERPICTVFINESNSKLEGAYNDTFLFSRHGTEGAPG